MSESSESTARIDHLVGVIAQAADALQIEAYLVGGFVRDRLLGRPLKKDIDLVTVNSDGVPLLDAVAKKLQWARPVVFERFGTAQIRSEEFIVEVVRARAERYDPESRKPDVRAGTLQEDIMRRDFTVNALAQTLRGDVLDLTGHGLDDLHAGVLRTPFPADETFSEDPLRMFRAARFVSQLGFSLADGIIDAMQRQAARARILSAERIRDEFARLLLGEHPREGLEVLCEGKLLDAIDPALAAMTGVEQGGWHTDDVWHHTINAVAVAPPDLITRLATFFHDIGKPPTHSVNEEGKHTFYDHPKVGAELAAAIMERLRFSNDEIAAVSLLVRMHLRPIQYRDDEYSDAAVRRLIRDVGDLRSQLLDVAGADTKASAYPDADNIDALEARARALDEGGEVSHLKPPLDGRHLMALTGRGPGPWVGKVQRALMDAVVEGELPPSDREAAERWLRDHQTIIDNA